ncbi:MAG: Rne/Rng family ribonuclease [Blastocatellia bacterium]
MSKELIVSVNGREKKIAIVEDDLVTEFYVERGDENQGIVGNIYKGRVMKVLPGMQSAFVDIGLERDSFLYVSDFFDEDMEEDLEEKREAARPQPRSERTRRDTTRTPGPVIVAEAEEEEEEDDMALAALGHIEEITAEPVIEPAEDDEMVGEAGAEGKGGSRQRRQRRLRYPERPRDEAAEAPAPARKRGAVAEAPEAPEAPEVVEAEEETSGRRRRRGGSGRRRRGAEPDAAPVEAAVEETEEYTPFVLVHHEPLERVTDDETEGDMLRDAMLQERIAVRTHAEERRTELLDVEPTPEIEVGSLRHSLDQSIDFERIIDDSGESAEAPTAELMPELMPEPAEEAASEAEAEPVETAETEEAAAEPLEEASAEVRQRPRRGHMATRRGGRGRRRTYRTRGPGGVTDATADAEEEPAEGEEPAKPAAPPPPPSSSAPRSNERFSRPVITDLLREGQEIIVQIAKEPIGQKGARITSHVALPGRYIVYMPTVEHIGVSRKIGTDEERQRLKRTLHQLRLELGAPGGFIVRTAANGCTPEELREDIQYLLRTWTDIRRRSDRVKGPAIVHRDLDLIQRILRDQLSSDFTAIRSDNEFEYERIVDFVNRFAPKLVSRVKLYTKETPILEHYGVQGEIDKAVKPRVWLRSGGYIVINQTEALVAIDVNTGKFVGKSNRLEDTIVKTNLEAAKEIVRQIRLRDLGGIIVLDFIDMEERKNRQKVMQALEYELRNDRSPSKILQFNDFGLVAITRKRVKQSLERTLCTPCSYCGGAGMVKSAQTVTYEILAEARRISKEVDSHNEAILRVNPEVAKALRGPERDVLMEIDAYLGGVVTIKSDPTVHQEQFDIAMA